MNLFNSSGVRLFIRPSIVFESEKREKALEDGVPSPLTINAVMPKTLASTAIRLLIAENIIHPPKYYMKIIAPLVKICNKYGSATYPGSMHCSNYLFPRSPVLHRVLRRVTKDRRPFF
jgi:hypothetical protein